MPCQKRRRPVAAATSLVLLTTGAIIYAVALGFIRDTGSGSSSPSLRSDNAQINNNSNNNHRGLLNLPQLLDPKSTEPRIHIHTTNNGGDNNNVISIPVCTSEAIGALTSALHADLRASLRPLSVPTPLHLQDDTTPSTTTTTIDYDGLGPDLMKRAFINNRIVMMGDSTMAIFSTRLRSLMTLTMESHPFVSTLSSSTNIIESDREIIKVSNENIDKNDLKSMGAKSLLNEGGTAVMKVRIHWGLDELKDKPDLQSILDFKPKVILSNVGLHTLHTPTSEFGKVEGEQHIDFHTLNHWNFSEEDIARMKSWLEYERFLAEMIQLAKDSGAEMLLLKTTNLVCDQMYKGDWKTGVELYNNFDEATLNQCFERIKESLTGGGVQTDDVFSDDDIHNYCKHGVLNAHGSDELNRRLFAFVENYHKEQEQQQTASQQLKVIIYNDRDMQDCGYTRPADGRHYHALNLARIRLLGHYIDGCL